MTRKIRIDFISDVVCPWCAVGLHGLEEALRRTADIVQADIHFQPFELNPKMQAEGENIDEHLAEKYGSTREQMAVNRERITERAAGVGFTIRYTADSRIYNTFDAHRLLHWAETTGQQRELQHALLQANFTDGENVADHAVLVRIAAAAGLDADAAREVLASGRYTEEVRAAEQLWLSRGINSVPGIVIDEKWLISGGQPPEAFEQALRQIAAEA
jgi:predicted DsbA family dithiol-disulfide isomerase